jgi:hypothetical protein
MRLVRSKIVRITVAICLFASVGSAIQAQSAPEPTTLFQQLQSDQTSTPATEKLLRLGKSDVTVRAYLVTHLPSMIEAGPEPSLATWSNATRLAGGLKIAEAAPALVKYIDVTTGTITLSGESHLRTSPAGLALVQIGDPAVLALDAVLEQGNLDQRWKATYTLKLIGSAKAKTVLRNHGSHEADENHRAFIEKATAK